MKDVFLNTNTVQQLRDSRVHSWYRFVLSYPDHVVTRMLDTMCIQAGNIVLDPFVGTGTTLIECKKRGIHSIGIDANPVTAFASQVKTTWNIDLTEFDRCHTYITETVRQPLAAMGRQYPVQETFDDLWLPEHSIQEMHGGEGLGDEQSIPLALIPKDWISEAPLRKIMLVKQVLDNLPDDAIRNLFKLALAAVVVTDASNLGFGPEVYLAKKRRDADVYGALIRKLREIRNDLAAMQVLSEVGRTSVHTGDARHLASVIQESVDAVITSPPYPNEKDYTRTTRLELLLLGYLQKKSDLRQIKEAMLRSHTRNIFATDNDGQYVQDIPEIQALAEEIEQQRIARGATSGFERLYHRVVTEYFGGMYRVLEQLRRVLRPGGKLALVVGDQMSFFRVPIGTAKLLSLVACRKLGYVEKETIIWRRRRATATRMDIEEHILVLERP